MLRHGTKLNGVQWTPQVLEQWLFSHCWPMGYSQYPTWKIDEMRQRLQHAIQLVQTAQASAQGSEPWRPPQNMELSRHGSGSSLGSITMPMPEPSNSPPNGVSPPHSLAGTMGSPTPPFIHTPQHSLSGSMSSGSWRGMPPQSNAHTPSPAPSLQQQSQAQWRPPLGAHAQDPRYNGVAQQHWRSSSSPSLMPAMGTPSPSVIPPNHVLHNNNSVPQLKHQSSLGNGGIVVPPNHILHNRDSDPHMRHHSHASSGSIVIPPPPIIYNQPMFPASQGFQAQPRRPMV